MLDQKTLHKVLADSRTIAVVGISADPGRPSYFVAEYLQQQGYRVIPVNPKLDEVLGQKCYPSLSAIPEPVDIVDVFRKSADALEVAKEAVAIGAKTLWLQIGVINEAAEELAQKAGLAVVMDRCIKVEHLPFSISIISQGKPICPD